MTQRIVIKTAVTKTTPTVQVVSYQWHWRRIFAVSSVVLLSAAGVTYGLTNVVNADEMHLQAPDNIPSAGTVVAHLADENVSGDDALASTTVAVVGKDSEITAVSVARAPAILVVTEVEPELPPEKAGTVASETVEGADEEDAEQEIAAMVTETVFSESAHIANVALGAKIDTNVVSRAVLTTGIEKREPIDVLNDNLKRTQFSEKLYFFTEIKNLQDKTVHHLWFHQDQLMAEIPLPVNAVRYRTYSSKNIMPSQTGQWRVEVVTQQGQLLAQKSFRIIPDAQ
ncbi:DUF2914 domain-containing protein [Pseudoalteromonas aurantia]|uniref:DUF2914 domain-containing protein n=1 Tax=Pseudoalteromonas aurantia 208 TaxID=1314867 RepID=A0ABR9E6M9_9GAMM|nr:DUF2914 domain-containing protein [Pseudoalteromonas aurantia]MBE0366643.1 hypothetical protein [Pseudoalteromonas aurantia 208]